MRCQSLIHRLFNTINYPQYEELIGQLTRERIRIQDQQNIIEGLWKINIRETEAVNVLESKLETLRVDQSKDRDLIEKLKIDLGVLQNQLENFRIQDVQEKKLRDKIEIQNQHFYIFFEKLKL